MKHSEKRKHPAPDSASESEASVPAAPVDAAAAVAPPAEAGEPSATAGSPSGDDAVAALQAELELVRTQANDRHLRARAEFDNYRKRVQRELGEMSDVVRADTIQAFLTVFDHFRMALDHAAQAGDTSPLKQGMDLIAAEFARVLEGLGVTLIDATGQPFDPAWHEALARESSATVPEGHVLRQWKAGFRLGDRLLRPATVTISSGAAPATGPATGAGTGEPKG